MTPTPIAEPALATSRRGLLRGSAGALLMSGLAASAAAAAAAPAQDIDAIIERAMKQAPFPAVVVAARKGETDVYRKAFGYIDLENKVAATTDDVFPIGSVTKTMTGLSVMQLVAQGRIGLDDTAATYLDGLPPAIGALKVRNLLDHTSGLVGYTDVPGFPWASQRPFTRQEVVGWFADKPLQFEPGTRWSYTNSGLYLLGLIIEKVSGASYEDYLAEHVFKPFRMTNSSMAGWERLIPRRAHGYLVKAGALENAPRYDPLVPFSAGGVLSTLDDMMKYRRGVFGDGPTTPQVRQLIQQQDKLKDGLVLPYALGCLAITTFEGHRKIGHPGDIFGFSSQYSYYPDDDLTIVMFSNMQNGAMPLISLEQKVARALLGVPQPTIVDLPLSKSLGESLAGSYEIGEIRFAVNEMTFTFKDGALYVAFEHGPPIALRHQGGNEFVSSLDDEHRFRFDTHGRPARVFMSYYGSTFEATRAEAR
ncbi:serine hydrolase domain-containing protein [Phenylobacterium sp.]|uniref:serine hydrolase domain-containing protein n=1 Tax=Phenylobacterium sp. TaxID=1871053 RepID=UPI0035B195F4